MTRKSENCKRGTDNRQSIALSNMGMMAVMAGYRENQDQHDGR